MSVDPLWAKYAPLQPYHYAGNEPVGRLDWSGRDYDVIFGQDEKGNATVTVSARFYVKKEDLAALKAALEKIKEKAGLIVDLDGKKHVVAFDLEPIVVDNPVAELNASASRENIDENGMVFDKDPETNTNSFETGKLNANNPGLTTGGRAITVDPSQSGCSAENVVVHELLHTLGVSHKNAGVMTVDCAHKQHSSTIFDGFIKSMINGSDKRDDPGVGTRTVKGK